jgi:hypothetical protein
VRLDRQLYTATVDGRMVGIGKTIRKVTWDATLHIDGEIIQLSSEEPTE